MFQITRITEKLGVYDALCLLLIGGFVYFKWSFLALPFYWDEAWVYGPAVLEMINNGPSLLPNAINTDLSRGHPLLFHFLAGLWGKLFGSDRAILHGFALFVTCALLFSTYYVGKYHFNRLVGLFAMALLIFSEKILTQSGLLLPEIMLALFSLWAIHAYLIKSPLLFVFTASAALFTKESALVLIVALLCWHSYTTILASKSKRTAFEWYGYLLLPLLFTMCYFIYQKHLFGWYLYPLHSDMVSFDLNEVKGKFKIAFTDLFELQFLNWLTVLIGSILPIIAFRKILGWKKALLIAVVGVAAIKVLFGRWPIPDPWKLVFALPLLASLFFLYFEKLKHSNPALAKFLGLGWLFILGFMLFSGLNFFANRYLIVLMPIVSIGLIALLYQGLKAYSNKAFTILSLGFVVLYAQQIGAHNRSGDCELIYANNIDVQQQIIDYFLERDLEYATIYTSFVAMHNMSNPQIGYLPEGAWFGNLRNEQSSDFEYAVFTSDNPDLRVESRIIRDASFELIVTVESGKSEGRIYRRIINS